MDKKIQENSMGSGAIGVPSGGKHKKNNPIKSGAPFNKPIKREALTKTMKVGSISVVDSERGNKKNKKPTKSIPLESKSERSLREAIRSLVFLNRVKYHEEQAINEMQEQKVRKIIRHLLKENDQNYNTTGQQKAAQFYEKIAVTFKEYIALVSTQKQRDEFKKMYLTGIKLALDGLDEQYKLVNPGGGGSPAAAPVQNNPGALAEAEGVSAPPGLGTPAPVNPLKNVDAKPVFQQAIAGAVSAAGITDPTGHGGADSALIRDLPQLQVVGYNDLTFEEFEVTNADGTVRTTSDRRDFRLLLLGDMEQAVAGQPGELGRIAGEFKRLDMMKPTSDMKNKENPNVPATSAPETPAAPTGAPVEPVAGAEAPVPPSTPEEETAGL